MDALLVVSGLSLIAVAFGDLVNTLVTYAPLLVLTLGEHPQTMSSPSS